MVFLWAPPSIIVSNLTPGGACLVMKVLWDDNLTPFSRYKIRAKIFDLDYGGARRALQYKICKDHLNDLAPRRG